MMPQGFPKSRVVPGFCLSLLFVAGLIQAAALTPLGTLRSTGVVYVGERLASAEAVIFNGDHLKTEEGRAAISLSRGDLVVLERQSAATLHNSSGGPSIGLERGKLSLAVSGPRPIRVESDGLTLSPTGAFPSLSEMAVGADRSVVVAVRRGALSVANLRPEPVVVRAGQVLTISPRAGQSQEQSVGTAAHGKMTLGEKLRTFHIGGLSHTASVGLAVGGLGGAAAAAAIVPAINRQTVSPSGPR